MTSDKGKPDFSNVKASTATTAPAPPRADFSSVKATASSTAAAPGPEPAAQTYTVAKGDSLSKIAKRFYGNANRWKWIHEANREQVPNPDLIRVGQVLVIPPVPKS